jgi:hypothetical protein
MLTHSHSATSLYNLRQFKPISDQFTSIVYVVPASNLRTSLASFGLVLMVLFFANYLPFSHFGFKNILILSCFHVPFYLRYYSEVIYQHENLSSSGKKSNATFIILWYIYSSLIHSKTIIVLCNILNSQNIAGNIFVNEQRHRKIMFSGGIELNPGPVFLY